MQPMGPMEPAGPVGEAKRGGTVLVVVVVLLAVAAAVTFGVVALWPSGSDGDAGSAAVDTPTTNDDDDDGDDDGDDTDTTDTTESQVTPESTTPTTASVPVDLLRGGFGQAFADLLAASGNPAQLMEVSVYDTYAFLAYRDPADPASVDERQWRDGEVGEARANTGRDRVDADTEPRLFTPADVNPVGLELLVADAPSHYDIPTTVSHVIIDRFLPFDERVLVRVYTVPSDGRSGGGYVSYDAAGNLVNVCC